jgi:hypothetical protein
MSAGFHGQPSSGHISGLVKQKAQRGDGRALRLTDERPALRPSLAPRAFQEKLSIRLSHQVVMTSAD